MNARSLLGLIALEAALTVAVLLYTPPSLSRVAADDCDSVRDGLAVQIGTTLELELHHARTDPSVSPAVAAVRGAQQLWGIVPPSPNDSSQPAFAIVESTDFVPIKSRACTAYVRTTEPTTGSVLPAASVSPWPSRSTRLDCESTVYSIAPAFDPPAASPSFQPKNRPAVAALARLVLRNRSISGAWPTGSSERPAVRTDRQGQDVEAGQRIRGTGWASARAACAW